MSVGSVYTFGSVRDAVYVLRAADGVAVYLRYSAHYAQTRVAFVGSDYLAFSAGGETEVVRLPD